MELRLEDPGVDLRGCCGIGHDDIQVLKTKVLKRKGGGLSPRDQGNGGNGADSFQKLPTMDFTHIRHTIVSASQDRKYICLGRFTYGTRGYCPDCGFLSFPG